MSTYHAANDDFDRQSDRYSDYEARFDPMQSDRQARRKRKPKVKHTPKKDSQQVLQDIADPIGMEGGFETTYRPSLFEQGWLEDSLRPFIELEWITDVLGRVRGGKEANVYRCAAHPRTGYTLLAAKVYRPRMFRSLSNDAMYREGRTVLDKDGKLIKDDRSIRAMGKKTGFGVQVAHTSWLSYEYTTLQTLHMTGAAVPEPIATSSNALLMGYVGDESIAAPALSEVKLQPDEAQVLFLDVLRNVELMLKHGVVHGDLSAYNILYWDGEITLIDFPQVVSLKNNSNARFILERDIQRVCEYFSAQGVACEAPELVRRLWRRYNPRSAQDTAADLSRFEVDEE